MYRSENKTASYTLTSTVGIQPVRVEMKLKSPNSEPCWNTTLQGQDRKQSHFHCAQSNKSAHQPWSFYQSLDINASSHTWVCRGVVPPTQCTVSEHDTGIKAGAQGDSVWARDRHLGPGLTNFQSGSWIIKWEEGDFVSCLGLNFDALTFRGRCDSHLLTLVIVLSHGGAPAHLSV